VKHYRLIGLLVSFAALLAAGCKESSPGKPQAAADTPQLSQEEKTIAAALDKLSPEDRKLAEAQKFCAVDSENRLGAMGKPAKIMVKGEPVFLCCKHCVEEAEKDPDKTLAKLKELKAKTASK
jgi:hypothetical protein